MVPDKKLGEHQSEGSTNFCLFVPFHLLDVVTSLEGKHDEL